jgi:mono/diheme cytochrome c family protein
VARRGTARGPWGAPPRFTPLAALYGDTARAGCPATSRSLVRFGRSLLAALALAIVGCESSHTTLEDWLAKIDWFPTMRRQPSIEAYEDPRLPADGTLPIGAEFPLSLTEAEKITANPLAPTAASLERGRAQYEVFCSLCHGAQGSGGGSVAATQTGFPPGLIPSLTAERARALTDGYLYGMIVNGRGLMPSYRRIPEEDRWHIVNYVRDLQRQAVAAPAEGG